MLVGVNGTGWWLANEGAPKAVIVGVLVATVGLSFAAERLLPHGGVEPLVGGLGS